MNVEDAKKILLTNIEILTPEVQDATRTILLELNKAENKISNLTKKSDRIPLHLENLPNEIWRDIEGYEGLYKISNKGRVKSLHWKNEKMLNPSCKKRSYYALALSKNGISKTFDVHILVAKTFIPNPENKPVVHHKDSNPLNNNVENLEWVTYSENTEKIYNEGIRKRKLSSEQKNYIIKAYKPFDKDFGANCWRRLDYKLLRFNRQSSRRFRYNKCSIC